MSGRSAPRSTQVVTGGVSTTPSTVPPAIVNTSPKAAWVGARMGRQAGGGPSPRAR